MIVHTDFSRFRTGKPYIVTIGTFDGVHLGHRAILQRLKSLAETIGGETVLLTFYPHPRMVIHPEDHDLRLLSSPAEKAALLSAAGIDHLIVYPFSEEFSRLPAVDYIRDLLVNGIGAHTVVAGYDHRFGRNREGDFSTLRELSEIFGYQIEEIPARDIDDVHVSSTKIRHSLAEGNVEYANRLLGYPYSISGQVVHGEERGRTIGFPTANISPDYPYKLIPDKGVYAIHATIGSVTYPAVLNIGVRPTVQHNGKLQIEAHLLGFDQMIYGENLSIQFAGRIRSEQKFASVQDLQKQIAADIETAKGLL